MFIPDYTDEFVKDEVALVDGYWEGDIFIDQHNVPDSLFRDDISVAKMIDAKRKLAAYNPSISPAFQDMVPVWLLNEEAREAVKQGLLSKGGDDPLWGRVWVGDEELHYGASFGVMLADEPVNFTELSPKSRKEILKAALDEKKTNGEFFDEPHAYERRIRFYEYHPERTCSGDFIVHLPGDYIQGEFSQEKRGQNPFIDLGSIRRNLTPDYELDVSERAVVNELVHSVISDIQEQSLENGKPKHKSRGL